MIQLDIFDFCGYVQDELFVRIDKLRELEEYSFEVNKVEFSVKKNEFGMYELITSESESAFKTAKKCYFELLELAKIF